jgi:hypothetical protein
MWSPMPTTSTTTTTTAHAPPDAADVSVMFDAALGGRGGGEGTTDYTGGGAGRQGRRQRPPHLSHKRGIEMALGSLNAKLYDGPYGRTKSEKEFSHSQFWKRQSTAGNRAGCSRKRSTIGGSASDDNGPPNSTSHCEGGSSRKRKSAPPSTAPSKKCRGVYESYLNQ